MAKIVSLLHEDAGGTMAEWKALVGSPARLILADPRAHDGTIKVPGTIRDVSVVGITVELFVPLLNPRVGSIVMLEVMAKTALLQCQTTIQHSSNPQCFHLVLPDRVHRVQRRQFPRATVSVSASIKPLDDGVTHEASVTNLSVGGCAALVPVPLAHGLLVRLDLHMAGLEPTRMEAQVVRCSMTASATTGWEVGLAFGNITEEQRNALQAYVELFK